MVFPTFSMLYNLCSWNSLIKKCKNESGYQLWSQKADTQLLIVLFTWLIRKMLTCFVTGPDEVWMVTNWTSEFRAGRPLECSGGGRNIAIPSALGGDMLVNHILQQPNAKPYQCKTCGASYSMQKNLLSHMRKECGREAHLQCPLCPMKTKRKGNLKRHMLFVHTKL